MENNIFDQLSSLTDEEFMKLISEYDFSKMSTLPVSEQKYIQEKLNEEMERRRGISSDLESKKEETRIRIDDIKEKLKLFEKITNGDYEAYPGSKMDIDKLNEELKELEQYYYDADKYSEVNEEIIDSAEKVVSSTKLSVAKRRLDTGKKALFVTAPQKICTLSRRLLDKVKKNTEKFGEASLSLSNNVNDKFEEYSEKNDDALKAIDNAMDDLMQDMDQMHGYEKYQARKAAEKNMEKMGRKYRRVERKGKIVSKLRPGIVRMLKVPSTIIDKLSGKANDANVPIQESVSMNF